MSQVDLHVHTTASDGKFTPSDIVRKSAALGLTVISICDHDTVNGIAEALTAAQSFSGLRVIPGVEISTDVPHGEVHVLGYFIDYFDEKLLTKLEKMRNSRQIRAQRMVEKLGSLGIHIEWQRVREIAGSGAIGRPHVAQAMVEKGYITSPKEAFAKYIGRDGPAYVEREKLTPVETVELILQSKGLPVLAHPMTLNKPESMVIELKAAGLVGVEAYYDGHAAEDVESMVSLAKRHNLIATGGSDYHGQDESNETMIGGANVPLESAERLITLAKSLQLKLAG